MDLTKEINSLKLLPNHDKDYLLMHVGDGYVAVQNALKNLSIFSSQFDIGEVDGYEFQHSHGSDIYYAGVYDKTDLGIFFDSEKKIYFNSRYYLTHLSSFFSRIDSCLHHLSNININDNIFIGEKFIAIEKWFISYGHFKDEIYSLGHLKYSSKLFEFYKPIIDFPLDKRLNTQTFSVTQNYTKISNLIFDNFLLNPYTYENKILKLSDLFLFRNQFMSPVFHSFPIDIANLIKHKIGKFSTDIPFNKYIFITRSSSYRDITNKIQVEEYLSKFNFFFVNPEDLAYEDFVLTISQADIIVMYYGSAMTNMTYLKEGAKVFVLKSASYASENLGLWKNLINAYKLTVSEINVNLNGEIELDQFDKIILC